MGGIPLHDLPEVSYAGKPILGIASMILEGVCEAGQGLIRPAMLLSLLIPAEPCHCAEVSVILSCIPLDNGPPGPVSQFPYLT